MEQEILSTLREIKAVIYVLTVAVIIGVVIRSVVLIKSSLRQELDKFFEEEAKNFLEKGAYDELIVLCQSKLKDKPNHSFALWYISKAYYQKNDYSMAKKYFEKLAQSEPSWEQGYVQPHLERIQKSLSGATPDDKF